jgi:hypothetical protein
MRDLSIKEKVIIEEKVEKFLNNEVFSWKIINEDEGMEEEIIKEIIKTLEERISYY